MKHDVIHKYYYKGTGWYNLKLGHVFLDPFYPVKYCCGREKYYW